jgi:hypothetical protein
LTASSTDFFINSDNRGYYLHYDYNNPCREGVRSAVQSEQGQQQQQDNNDPDLVYIDQSIDTGSEESSAQVSFETTHLHRDDHVRQQQQKHPQSKSQHCHHPHYHHRPPITADDIRRLAHAKFENSGKRLGLTWQDLVNKGPYKSVDTKLEAQDTIHHHKKEKNLYTNSPGTKPQQYFATEDEAKIAAINNRLNTQLNPSGVPQPTFGLIKNSYRQGFPTKITATATTTAFTADPINNCLQELKANNFLQALLAIPSVATKWHNHRYEFCLLPDGPDPPSAPYYDRLGWIKPDPKKSQAKTLPPTYIGGYEIIVDVYPNNGKVIIALPSKDYPLPFPNTEELANEFLAFLGAIKGYIERCLSDKRGVLVPSVLSWRLVHADINKDVPCSPELFLTFPKMEIIRADGVFRAYARMLHGCCHFRFEKGNHVFNQTMEHVITSLVKEVGQESSSIAASEEKDPALYDS